MGTDANNVDWCYWAGLVLKEHKKGKEDKHALETIWRAFPQMVNELIVIRNTLQLYSNVKLMRDLKDADLIDLGALARGVLIRKPPRA